MLAWARPQPRTAHAARSSKAVVRGELSTGLVLLCPDLGNNDLLRNMVGESV
jgi:hypothetical protein